MINLPAFPFKDPQAFYDNLVASQRDPNSHQPDPAKGAALLVAAALFLLRHPPLHVQFNGALWLGLIDKWHLALYGCLTFRLLRFSLPPAGPGWRAG
jgi:hypothetical protein